MSEADNGDNAPNYENPGTKDRLDEHRQQLQREERQEQIEQAHRNQTARQQIASEDPESEDHGIDLRETYEVEFRDYPFEFAELGDTQVKAAQFEQESDEVEAGTDAAEFVYETLGEKCLGGPTNIRGDPTTEAWWRQFDVSDVIEVFQNLVEQEVDVDPEVRDDIDQFPDE